MTHRIFSSMDQIPQISLNSLNQGRYGSAAMLVVIVKNGLEKDTTIINRFLSTLKSSYPACIASFRAESPACICHLHNKHG